MKRKILSVLVAVSLATPVIAIAAEPKDKDDRLTKEKADRPNKDKVDIPTTEKKSKDKVNTNPETRDDLSGKSKEEGNIAPSSIPNPCNSPNKPEYCP